jgi:cell division transport system ATP-binding protein
VQALEQPAITFANVSYGPAGEAAISDFNLTIEKGSLTILLGPSGSGKSTLLKMLTGELQPASGNVLIDGSDIMNDVRRHRRRLGLISSDIILHDDRSVHDSLELPLEITGVSKERRRERVADVIDRFGLSEIKEKYPKLLSMGERQRVLLARAVATEPFVLVADEPAAHLDLDAVQDIVRLIERENLRGMTVLLATSDPDFAARFAGSTVVYLSRPN